MENNDLKDKINTFFSQYKPLMHKTSEQVMSPEKNLDTIFYIKKGAVKMYALSEDGEEITLHIFRESSFFPFMVFQSSIKNSYYYTTLGETETIAVPAVEVAEFVKNNSDVLYDLSTRYADAIMGLLKRIEGIAFLDAYNKVVSLLLYLADKFGENKAEGTEITLELNHQDVASWVNVRRETASRQIEKLIKAGLISVKDQRFLILDKIGLQQTLKYQS